MNRPEYDVIVLGARCAGSPTAMLLARRGYRVLAVDKAAFPSDTVSTHLVHPPAIAALHRWGLLDRVVATGCPAIETYTFDVGPFAITGRPGTNEFPAAYAPRRTVLDKILVSAAAEAGVEVREEFTVEGVLQEDGGSAGFEVMEKDGKPVEERARVVSARTAVGPWWPRRRAPRSINDKPPVFVGYYSYWSGLPMNGRLEGYMRPDRSFAAWPTNDDLTLVIAGWPDAEMERNKKDIEGNYLGGRSTWPPPSRPACGRPSARSASSEWRCRTIFEAVRARLGPGGRRGLQPGLHHRIWNHGRVSPGGLARPRSIGSSAAPRPMRLPWASTSPLVTSEPCRCTT